MAIEAESRWMMEGELLELHMNRDRLAKKKDMSEEERARLSDIERRIEILQEALRRERMRV